MKKKAIIEDIDGPLYPHKQQYSAFFRTRYDGHVPKQFIEDFLKSKDFYYVGDFLIARGMDDPAVRELLRMHGIKDADLKEAGKQYMRKTMKEFGDSAQFMKGVFDQMNHMNGFFRKRGMKVIGATSRATNANPNDVYNNGVQKTSEWRARNGIELDATYYYLTRDKYHVLEDIKRDFFIEPHEVLAVVEDVADSLPGFMDRGIPAIMIDVGSEHQREKARKLYPKYLGMLHVMHTHQEAKDLIMEMYIDSLRR